MDNTSLIITLILGIFISIFGYRLKKIVFFIAWFLIGFKIMTTIMPFISLNFPDLANSDFWQNLLPIIGGLLLSLIGFSIEKACIALLCLFTIVSIGIDKYGFTLEVVAVSGIIGVFAAGFATMLIKPAIIIITSMLGASVITKALLELAPSLDPETYEVIFFLTISAVGALTQFLTTKRID